MMMTISEVAKYLRCSERKVHDLIHRDEGDPEKIPAYRVGRRILITEEEVKAHLEKNCRV